MADKHYTTTVAVDSEALLSWSAHRNRDVLMRDGRATLETSSIRDWLMNEISASRSILKLASLDWLATSMEARHRTTEHMDSTGEWWHVWILERNTVFESIAGLDELVRLTQDKPHLFNASSAEVAVADDWDRNTQESIFEIPDGGDGDDPIYVLCAIRAFRHLLNLAYSQDLPVVHMKYSYRAR